MIESSEQALIGGLRCYRCKTWKLTDAFSPSMIKSLRSPECRECRRQRGKEYQSKPDVAERRAEWSKQKRVALIAKHDGNHEETIQECCFCPFSGLSRHFVQDKASPTGHNNVCLACMRDRSQAYKRKHRLLVRQQNRDYKKRNREKVNFYARKYRKSSPERMIINSVRRSIARALDGVRKSASSLALLGVNTIEEYKAYLESRFELGMSWDNYGNGVARWNIDHIRELFRFSLSDPKEQRKAFHHTNTRPMWQSENGTNGAIARWRKGALK